MKKKGLSRVPPVLAGLLLLGALVLAGCQQVGWEVRRIPSATPSPAPTSTAKPTPSITPTPTLSPDTIKEVTEVKFLVYGWISGEAMAQDGKGEIGNPARLVIYIVNHSPLDFVGIGVVVETDYDRSLFQGLLFEGWDTEGCQTSVGESSKINTEFFTSKGWYHQTEVRQYSFVPGIPSGESCPYKMQLTAGVVGEWRATVATYAVLADGRTINLSRNDCRMLVLPVTQKQ